MRQKYLFGGNRSVMKGNLLLTPKRVFIRLVWHCSGVTETSHVAIPAHVLTSTARLVEIGQ
jgi:hypothetical protein